MTSRPVKHYRSYGLFSHIYTTGEHELTQGLASLPATSSWAERFGCAAREQRAVIVDSRGGYVVDAPQAGESHSVVGPLTRPGAGRGVRLYELRRRQDLGRLFAIWKASRKRCEPEREGRDHG